MRVLRRPARALRTAVDEMPIETRRAMLDALGRNPIIVGAYASSDGGVCPMLAAHRNGGRTDYAEFARAWDRYAHAGKKARRATQRELNALRTMLSTSIAEDGVREHGALARAIAEHRRTLHARARREEHEIEPYQPTDPRELDYKPSPGRMNCSSGITHPGEVLSR